MSSRVYVFTVTVAITDGEIIDSWAECNGAPLPYSREANMEFGDFEGLAIHYYRQGMARQAEEAAEMKRER